MFFTTFKNLTIVSFAPLLLIGCISSSSGSGSGINLHAQQATTAEYSSREKKLHAEIKNAPDTATEANARLHLAGLYLGHNNPSKNYKKALAQLEMFALLNKKTGRTFEIQNWLAVLKEINKMTSVAPLKEKILNDALKELKEINASREQQNQKLAAENAELKKTIEKLKYLDLNLERKRKDYR